MSLCISASKAREHYIAVDTAVSFIRNGISYRNNDLVAHDKLIIIDGEAYFFSGDMNLVKNLQVRFESQTDISFNKLTSIGKELFFSFADEGDELAFSKYGFDESGLAYAQFTNNWLDFVPSDRFYGNDNISFITYGKNMDQASKHIDLHTSEITPDFFIPIYEAVSDVGVGHSIYIYHLTVDKIGKTPEIPLRESATIKRASPKQIKNHYSFVGSGKDAFPVIMNGEGDGKKVFESDNPISPEMAGKPMSGRGFVSKPNGSFDILYYTSNYGRERSLRLLDDEVLVKSENSKIHMTAKNYEIEADQGGFIIKLSNGTNFELTTNGDIVTHATRNITFSADGEIHFNAQRYDFA